MARKDLSMLVLAEHFAPEVVRQTNRKAKLLSLLNIVSGDGQSVDFAVESDGASAAFFAEGADASAFDSDVQHKANLPWAQVRSNFSISGLARAAAASSRSPTANLNQWGREMVNATTKIASVVNQSLYTGLAGQTPGQIVGLEQAVGSLTNTYAGINRSTGGNEFWQPGVVSDPGSSTPITLDLVRSDIRAIYEKSGEKPDLAMVSPATFAKISKLFDGGRQYQIPAVHSLAKGVVTFEGGTSGITFDGVTFVEDKDCASNDGYSSDGVIYYLNSQYVELKVLPSSIHPRLDPGTVLTANSGFGSVPLMLDYEMLATTGDAKKAEIRGYMQLVCTKPSTCGTRRRVAAPAP